MNGNITHDPNALLLFAATLDSGGLPTVNLLDAILDDIKIYNRVLDSASVFDLFFEENRNLKGTIHLKMMLLIILDNHEMGPSQGKSNSFRWKR